MLTGIISTVAPFLFRLVEAKFKPKTGSTKMETVLNAIKAILGPLATSGDLGRAMPDDNELKAILEQLLGAEKAKNDWKETGTLSMGSKKYVVQVLGEL